MGTKVLESPVERKTKMKSERGSRMERDGMKSSVVHDENTVVHSLTEILGWADGQRVNSRHTAWHSILINKKGVAHLIINEGWLRGWLLRVEG